MICRSLASASLKVQLFSVGWPQARYSGCCPSTQMATPTGRGGLTIGFPTIASVSKSIVIIQPPIRSVFLFLLFAGVGSGNLSAGVVGFK